MIAGGGWLGDAGRLSGNRAVEQGMTGGTTAAAVVWEITGTAVATRELVEIKADKALAAELSVRVLVGAVLRRMV